MAARAFVATCFTRYRTSFQLLRAGAGDTGQNQ